MTPMIDVVFLLIIFFLVASHLSDQESHIEMELPSADSAALPEVLAASRITLNVPADGRFLFEGKQVSIENLKSLIQKGLDNHGPDLEIRIRSDQKVPYSSISPLLKCCATEGVWNVTFAVYEKEVAR